MTRNPKWLKLAARRSSARSWCLGMLLDEYASIEHLSREEVAAKLGCDVHTLEWLALCKRPSVDRFADDISRITTRFTIEPSKLIHIIRSVDVLKDMRERTNAAEHKRFLLAARDHDEEDHQ